VSVFHPAQGTEGLVGCVRRHDVRPAAGALMTPAAGRGLCSTCRTVDEVYGRGLAVGGYLREVRTPVAPHELPGTAECVQRGSVSAGESEQFPGVVVSLSGWCAHTSVVSFLMSPL